MAEEEVVAEVSPEPSDHQKRKMEDLAEEEVVAEVSTEPSDHQKRKLEDLELPETEAPTVDPNAKSNIASIMGLMKKEEEEAEEEAAVNGNGEAEAKRPRLEEEEDHKPDATENGYQEEKVDEPNEEVVEEPPVENNISEDTQEPSEKESVTVQNEEQPSDENPQLENAEGEPSKEDFKEPHQENQVFPLPEEAVSVSQQGDVSYVEQQPISECQTMSHKIEVPNAKVGVLIGKAGDTIRYMQLNSGARIQITRDADADPNAPTRPVELIGSSENINKAERLIKDVIAEADAGGSPALVARGFNTVQSSGAGEQIEIQVPIEKVGLILGKGGETIKNLQTRSGTRIQLIPQRLPEGDQSRERTVRVIGDKKQVEMAAKMIKEVMNQHIRTSPLSSGYNQGSRPRGPAGSQWGPQGPRPSHQTGYDYAHRGPPYPSQNPQMPPAYGNNYPPQQMDPRTNFNRDQRPPPPSAMQGPPPQGSGGGYNYYGSQSGPTPSGPPSNPAYSHGPGPTPTAGPPHSNYNYGQPAPYSQTAPPAQSYSHTPQQNLYGGHTAPQQSAYPQGGYGPQDQYGKPPHAQSYALPRANQPGDMPYQVPPPSTQLYGPNVPTQQPYPYASSGSAQQTYPPYGSAPIADGFNQPPATTTPAPGYQGGQPYGQQAPVYSQAGPTGGYVSYPSSQLAYPEQAAPNSAGYYGYQGPADPAYGAGQGAFGAPPPVQPVYDQSVPQSGSYGTVQGTVPVGYGKGLSPQPGYPQFDASQMHGAPR